MKRPSRRQIEDDIDSWLGFWHHPTSNGSPVGVRWTDGNLEIFTSEESYGDWLVIKTIGYREAVRMYLDGTLKQLLETEVAIARMRGLENCI